jgi:carbon storage regulator
MLVITRRVDERVKIGPDIWVMVTRVADGAVRLAIDAPSHVAVLREELLVKAKPKEAAK